MLFDIGQNNIQLSNQLSNLFRL